MFVNAMGRTKTVYAFLHAFIGELKIQGHYNIKAASLRRQYKILSLSEFIYEFFFLKAI